jgi:ketosteroid isomerase-like protein
MDARDKLTVPGETAARPDLEGVKLVYETIALAGVVAGIEQLIAISHEDVEMRAYAARAVAPARRGEQEWLHGHDEIREFFRSTTEQGFALSLRTRGFDMTGDSVLVRGSIRVGRPDGSFAEASVLWTFRFRDGLVECLSWEQRAGE